VRGRKTAAVPTLASPLPVMRLDRLFEWAPTLSSANGRHARMVKARRLPDPAVAGAGDGMMAKGGDPHIEAQRNVEEEVLCTGD